MPLFRNVADHWIDDLPNGKLLGPQEEVDVDQKDVEALVPHLERGHLVPVTIAEERAEPASPKATKAGQ